jgi:hypothetical protein
MSYVTLALIKSVLEITDTDRDAFLQICLDTASEQVEKICGGRTFLLDSSASARVFPTSGHTMSDSQGGHLLTPDIGSMSGVVVETGDGVTWATLSASSYYLEPFDSIAAGRPATSILAPSWTSSRVRVTARWGWPEVPSRVLQATLTQAIRLFKRPRSPEGILASAEWGGIRVPRADPDVEYLLSGLQLAGIA